MAEDHGFALPDHVFTEGELAELEAVTLDAEDYDVVEAVEKEELAPIDGRAPCEGDEEVLSAENEFPVPKLHGSEHTTGPADVDEEFPLPKPATTTTAEDGIYVAEEEAFQPFEGRIPSRILTAELQKAMYRARLIFHHTFEQASSKENNMLNRLMDEEPVAYTDCIVRLAVTQFIAWKETVGL